MFPRLQASKTLRWPVIALVAGIPCKVAHPCIGHIGEYTHPPSPCRDCSFLVVLPLLVLSFFDFIYFCPFKLTLTNDI